MTRLRKVGEKQISDQGAHIEAHRSVKGKFGINDLGLARRHHHGTGMQIAVDQCFGGAQKFKLQSLDRHLEFGVPAEIRCGFIELGGSPSIELRYTGRGR